MNMPISINARLLGNSHLCKVPLLLTSTGWPMAVPSTLATHCRCCELWLPVPRHFCHLLSRVSEFPWRQLPLPSPPTLYPPTPVHQPSMVPKACSVLEEIFFFSLHTLIRQYWLALTHIFLMKYYCWCLFETSFFLGQRWETSLGGSVGLWLKCFSSLSTAPLQL